jgi:hypothetical protein
MPHPTQPGSVIDVLHDSVRAARFVYGDSQPKPYLHVYDDDGITLLTKGESTGTYPHHRGIFIGWNMIRVGSASFDLWHMTTGTMRVVNIDRLIALPDSAIIVATIEWRAGTSGAGALLLTERRTMAVSKPAGSGVQIDCYFELHAAQTLTLNGDLQHAGIHFRAPEEVWTRQTETSYLSSPDGVVVGTNLRWCRLLFPIGTRWFTALQLNAPENPVQELSMREYGRFGYFFPHPLQTGEALCLAYRFVVAESAAPANPPKQSAEQIVQSRNTCDALYNDFVVFQSSDPDGDGQINSHEITAATNPFLPESVFKIRRIDRDENGAPYLEFPWLPVKTYRVWRSDHFDNWMEVSAPHFTFPEANLCRWTDSLPPPGPCFYRVTVQ